MKLSRRDSAATVLVLFGAVMTYAKMQSYSWWFLGSWKSALGLLACVGLAIFLLYSVDLARNFSWTIASEMTLWMVAGVVTVVSLIVDTTQTEFLWSTSLVGLSWLVQLASHAWGSATHGTPIAHSR